MCNFAIFFIFFTPLHPLSLSLLFVIILEIVSDVGASAHVVCPSSACMMQLKITVSDKLLCAPPLAEAWESRQQSGVLCM